MKIRRRDFIRLLGGVTGGLTLGAYALNETLNIPSKLLENAKNGPGIITWKATVCGMCPAGCSLKFKLIDGLPVYVKGNRIFPVNNGGVCPLAHGSLERLFHSERLSRPLVKKGIKGNAKFEKISWDDVFTQIGIKLKNLRKNKMPERMAFLGNNESSLEAEFISMFMKSFGSSNYFRFNFLSQSNLPFEIAYGMNQPPAYDVINAKTILTLGANILETGNSPIYYTKLFSSLRSAAKGSAYFIHVNPRKDVTGTFANLFVAIKPGTFGALALGLAYVLIREELIDRNFVNKFTFGFETWKDANGKEHEGFKNLILKNYYPEKVSKITNIPPEKILELGRYIGNNQPSIVIGGEYVDNDVNGFYSQWAIQSLNALLGNIGKEGGVVFPQSMPSKIFDSCSFDSITKECYKNNLVKNEFNSKSIFNEFSIEQFTENVLSGKPYPLEVLFIYRGDPLFQASNKNALREALKKIPLVIYLGSFINETALYSDLILPLPTYMEEWNVVENLPNVKFPHIGIRQPVVEPFNNLKSAPDLLKTIGKKIGAPVSANIKFQTYADLVKMRLKEIYLSGKGTIVAQQSGAKWLEFIGKRGWHLGTYESFEEFWQLALKQGGWWDPTARPFTTSKSFKTKTKKFEFFSNTLAEKLNKLSKVKKANLFRLNNVNGNQDLLLVPHFSGEKENSKTPLKLFIYSSSVNRDGSTSNLPMLQELFGFSVEYYWNTWAEINPETARQFGIKNNDWIWIGSKDQNIKLKVKLIPTVAKDVVSVPFGLGHKSFGKYAKGYGVNPLEIVKELNDPITGKPAILATNVNIEKNKELKYA